MADTPEKKVKDGIKRLLSEYSDGMYVNAPVPAGYGTPMLDFVGCYKGWFFAIEAKAKGKKPSRRQAFTIKQMVMAGGAVYVIDDEEGPAADELRAFFKRVDAITKAVMNSGPRQSTGNPSVGEAPVAGDSERSTDQEPLPPREDAT